MTSRNDVDSEKYRSGHNGAHSKCVCRATGTRVRIPPSPPIICLEYFSGTRNTGITGICAASGVSFYSASPRTNPTGNRARQQRSHFITGAVQKGLLLPGIRHLLSLCHRFVQIHIGSFAALEQRLPSRFAPRIDKRKSSRTFTEILRENLRILLFA